VREKGIKVVKRLLSSRGAAAATLAILLFGHQALASEAAVFKWTDENGIVHYSDVPLDPQAEDTGVRSKTTDARRIREEQLLAWERQQRDEEERETEQQQAGVTQARQAADREEIANRCTNARVRAERYATAHRLYEPMPDGGRRYLTDAQLSAAREAAELEITQWCGQGATR